MNRLFDLIGYDGCKHVILSAVIMVALGLFLPLWIAALITLAIGFAKEVYDEVSGKGHSEWKDLVADLVGIIIGIL